MGEKESILKTYIAEVVKRYLPKNEEIIHSGLFLILSQKDDLNIPDWYYNGYSVISETISSILQTLCKNRRVVFTNEGLYEIIEDKKGMSKEELGIAINNLEAIFSKYKNGIQVVKEANRVFKSTSVGVAG
jgi:hypothetical protein